ncbi:MAG: hypothetical protein AAF769_12035 [Pseudomonadota bacterium]
MNCIRLDREPVADEMAERCGTHETSRHKTGTFHRDIDRELRADVLPISVPRDLAAKLPVSDCLWVGTSQNGAGERIAPQWEQVADLTVLLAGEPSDDPDSYRSVGQFSGCRADRIYPRRSIDDSGITNRFCLSEALSPVGDGEPYRVPTNLLETFKSTCDLFDRNHWGGDELGNLLTWEFQDDGYGRCAPHSLPDKVAPEWPEPISSCSQADTTFADDVAFEKVLTVREDAHYVVDVLEKRTLWPRVRAVVGDRNIARRLQFFGQSGSWETRTLIQNANGQRWEENFSTMVRVRRVRLFSVRSTVADDREYHPLDPLTLTLVDRADNDNPIECMPTGDAFDLPACGIDATPTYLLNTLEASSDPLLAPLRWEISGELLALNRDWYLEFELDSVFRTRTATLAADISAVDFGEVSRDDVRSKGVTIRNVGSGEFVVDSVEIDPGFGDAAQFDARRLDDPITVPQPLIATQDGSGGIEYSDGGWDTPYDRSALRIIGDAVLIPRASPDRGDLEVLGVPLMIENGTPIVQTDNPDISGFTPEPGVSYPMTYRAWMEWPLPRSLSPNDARRIQVDVRPQHVGPLKARLHVSGYPLHAPQSRSTISVTLEAYGLTGPRGEILPGLMQLPVGVDANDTGNAVIASTGDKNLIIETAVLEDTGASGHVGDVANFRIDYAPATYSAVAPGASELVTIQYNPGCFFAVPPGGKHQARLRIKTNTGTHDIALRGDPNRWAQANGCVPGE